MKKIILVLIILVVFTSVVLADEWVNFNDRGESTPIYDVIHSTNSFVEFEIEIPGMNSRNVDEYQRVWIQENTRIDSVGFPEVPIVSYLIALPECDNVNISITLLDSVEIENMNIYPAPELVEITENGSTYLEEQFAINTIAYNTDDYFPGYSGELVEKGAVRDQHCIRLRVYPVQFNPVQQKIIAYSKINIEMTFDNAIGSLNKDVGIFNELCGSAMINYNSNGLSASVSSGSNRDGTWQWVEDFPGQYINEPCDYLIITADSFFYNDSAKIWIDSLAQRRAEYNGFDVVIVKMEDIENQISGDEKDEMMKSLIKNTYNAENANNTYDGKLGYVLLFGDAYFGDDLYDDCVPSYPYQDILGGYDVYFSQLTEIGGYPDVYPDILLGRCPVDNAEQVANVCQKIIDYEPIPDTTSWLNKITFLETAPGSAESEFEIILPMVENYENTLLSYRLYDDPNWEPPEDLQPYFDGGWFPSYPETYLNDQYAEGHFWISYMGHGALWRLHPDIQFWWSYDRISDPEDTQYDGKLPFITSMSCDTGNFQSRDDGF
ncbi:MAG: hypothetical protein KAW92_15405, partial [Candidatus Cloacimonetes bacterium]|nr:hypothetical protein [Candidatus Cloacimonadota bacterium]